MRSGTHVATHQFVADLGSGEVENCIEPAFLHQPLHGFPAVPGAMEDEALDGVFGFEVCADFVNAWGSDAEHCQAESFAWRLVFLVRFGE